MTAWKSVSEGKNSHCSVYLFNTPTVFINSSQIYISLLRASTPQSSRLLLFGYVTAWRSIS